MESDVTAVADVCYYAHKLEHSVNFCLFFIMVESSDGFGVLKLFSPWTILNDIEEFHPGMKLFRIRTKTFDTSFPLLQDPYISKNALKCFHG